MAKFNSFLITTTSNLEGYRIKEYLGTVAANIVTGTGFFTDLGAGFRDIFGGRSQGYQRQLEIINEEVLSKIENNAKKKGANSIIGTRIDYDEISGKGMQMFMVTVSGTAVIVEEDENKRSEEVSFANTVDSDIIIEQMQINWSIIALSKSRFKQNIAWDLFKKKQVYKAIEPVMNLLLFLLESSGMTPDFSENDYDNFVKAKKEYYKETEDFLLCFPPALINFYIYKYLTKGDKIYAFLESIIKEGKLLDLERVYELLDEKDHSIRKKTLKLLLYDKLYYNKEDIIQFEKLSKKIIEVFPDLSESKESGVFSKKEKWECSFCKNLNDLSIYNCLACGNDKFGFKINENNPEEMISYIQHKVSVIKDFLKE